jgi:hypothetical protein
MQIIHENPAKAIRENPEDTEALWQQVSAALYAEVVRQAKEDVVVRVGQRFDFEGVVAACAEYRLYAGGRGQTAAYTVEQLSRGLVLKHLKGWSYRQTCAELRVNLLLRWFVGFGVEAATFSYITLQRFGVWVCEHQPRLIFEEVLKQIDADFPAEREAAQVGDTYALVADVAQQSRTEMLRDGCRRLLQHGQAVSVALYEAVRGQVAWEALFGGEQERPAYGLEKAERDGLDLRTAVAAAGCLRQVEAQMAAYTGPRSLAYLALAKWVGIVAKLLADEFVVEWDAAGRAVAARFCTEKERGSFVLGSTVDPEATFRKHGERHDLGYNVQVAATANFIREIFAATGATPDGAGVAALIAHQQARLGQVPPKLIYDRAAGSPKIMHDVAQASGGQTQLVARLINHGKSSERFGPLDFTLHEDGSLTCPQGEESTKAYRSGSGHGWNYRFSAAQCQGCPLWERCRSQPAPAAATETAESEAASGSQASAPQPKPSAYRQVFISDYRNLQRTAILYTYSDAFKQDMKLRPAIERIIAALVRYNDARRARGYGLRNADFQARMAAVAFNLKRWAVLTREKEKAQRRLWPDSG